MARIAVEGDTVTISDAVLRGAEIASAFGGVPEGEREDFLRNAVLMGILARSATTDGFKVEELATKIRAIVSGTETNVNVIKASLEATVDGLLKGTEARVQSMMAQAGQRAESLEELEEARSLTAQAGREYEQEVGDRLCEIASHYGVEIDHVGESYGKSGKKGDYVIKFDEGDVVFEIKKTKESADKKQKRYTKKEIMDELVPAVRNRDAAYGIFITRDVASLPQEILALGTIGGGPYMACGTEEDGRPLPKILHIVCQMARLRMAIQNAQATDVEVAKIGESCREALDALNGARRKCKSIRETATAVETDAIDRIESLLKAVLSSL